MKPETEEQLKQLKNWSQALVKRLPNVEQQLRETLDGDVKLPPGCPSKESLALLIAQDIDKSLSEVNAAYKSLLASISPPMEPGKNVGVRYGGTR